MEDPGFALAWIAFFAMIFFGWYFYLQARNKERMALIEKNVNLSDIFAVRKNQFRFPWLKLGMLITGVGFGFSITVLIIFINELDFSSDSTGMLVASMMIFFGGVGMITGHYLDKPKDR